MLTANPIRTLSLLATILVAAPCFAEQRQAIFPISEPTKIDPGKLALGKKLYNDNLFSKNFSLSCSSCHALNKAGIDKLTTYQTLQGTPGNINTPTTLNASLNFRQFWDGRVKNLEEAIDDHIADKTIFDNQWSTIITRINESPSLKAQYANIYSDKVTEQNIKDALVSYLNNIITTDAPIDRFLKGDQKSLSEDAKKGFKLFKDYGCITCHQGPNIGGNLYEKLGIYSDYFALKTTLSKSDYGLYNVTGKEEDKFVFKVPSLRNVELTAPYLHDGAAKNLEEAIRIMGIYQVGQTIPEHEIPYIVKFLQSLTGKIPEGG